MLIVLIVITLISLMLLIAGLITGSEETTVTGVIILVMVLWLGWWMGGTLVSQRYELKELTPSQYTVSKDSKCAIFFMTLGDKILTLTTKDYEIVSNPTKTQIYLKTEYNMYGGVVNKELSF